MMTNDHLVFAWDSRGQRLAGWPPQASNRDSTTKPESVLAADVDGDGNVEVVANLGVDSWGWYKATNLKILEKDGKASQPPFRSRTIRYFSSTPGVADLDGDRDVELLHWAEGLYVWDLPYHVTNETGVWPLHRQGNTRQGVAKP